MFVGVGLFLFSAAFIGTDDPAGHFFKGARLLAAAIGIGSTIAIYLYLNDSAEIIGAYKTFEE